jgi:T5SS/PEP-CTERM-associated repeat protein
MINFSSGTINAAALNFNGTPSLLNWTGGTLNINNNVTFDSAAAGTTTGAAFGASKTIGSGQTLKITGYETLGGTTGTFGLTVGSGGTHTVTGDLTINHTGSLTVNSGGTTTVGTTVWAGEHATLPATISVSGSGATMQSGTMIIGNAGRGTLSVDDGGVVTNSAAVTLGNSATGIGMATISGVGSKLQPTQFQIGRSGQGTLTINNGGLAHPIGSSPSFFLGLESGGQGTLVINNGGTASSTSNVYAGYVAGTTGQITVNGLLQADVAVRIGRLGTGTMDVNAAGVVTTPALLIGSLGGGAGTVTVNGGTVVSSTSVAVGTATPSNGTMNVMGGGTVTAGQFSIAGAVDSTGNATIDGPGTTVTVQVVADTPPLNIAVGQRGNGTLAMTNGAIATAPVVSIGQYPGATGQATISSGAVLQATSYFGVGTAFNPFSDPPVDVGPVGGNGTLTVNTGSLAKAGVRLLTGNSGTVDLSGGGKMTVGDVGAGVPAAGSVLVGSGGTVSGTGTIIGAVVNSGGSVSPGFSSGLFNVNGSFSQGASGALQIELGGTTRSTGYDALLATGPATLGGTLQVSLINSFSPALNDTFDILDASGITGTFATLILPSLGGSLTWNTSQLYTTGVLSIAAGVAVPGDYNNNGAVDAADYVLWRKGGPLANEVDNPGTVNAADHTAWRARFGNSGSGTAPGATDSGGAAVPEPATVAVILIGVAIVMVRPRV